MAKPKKQNRPLAQPRALEVIDQWAPRLSHSSRVISVAVSVVVAIMGYLENLPWSLVAPAALVAAVAVYAFIVVASPGASVTEAMTARLRWSAAATLIALFALVGALIYFGHNARAAPGIVVTSSHWPEARLVKALADGIERAVSAAEDRLANGDDREAVNAELATKLLTHIEVVMPAAISSAIGNDKRDEYLAVVAAAKERSPDSSVPIISTAHSYLSGLLSKRADATVEEYRKLAMRLAE